MTKYKMINWRTYRKVTKHTNGLLKVMVCGGLYAISLGPLLWAWKQEERVLPGTVGPSRKAVDDCSPLMVAMDGGFRSNTREENGALMLHVGGAIPCLDVNNDAQPARPFEGEEVRDIARVDCVHGVWVGPQAKPTGYTGFPRKKHGTPPTRTSARLACGEKSTVLSKAASRKALLREGGSDFVTEATVRKIIRKSRRCRVILDDVEANHFAIATKNRA